MTDGALPLADNTVQQIDAPTDFDPVATGEKLAKETVVLELHVRAPGFYKTLKATNFVSAPDVEANGKPVADPTFLHVSQDLLDRKALKAIYRLQTEFGNWLYTRTVPSPIGLKSGFYLLRLAAWEDVEQAIIAFNKKRNELVNAFGAKYEQLVEDAKTRRGEFFDAADYPQFHIIKAKFSVESRWLSFSVPAALERVNRELYAVEQAKAKTYWADAAEEVRDALRLSFKQITEHFAERLGHDAETGKPKVFHESTVKNLREFLDTFNMRDLTDDAELKSLVDKAKELVTGVDVKSIRSEEGLRSALQQGFNQIKETASSMITVQKRKYRIEEDVATQEQLP